MNKQGTLAQKILETRTFIVIGSILLLCGILYSITRVETSIGGIGLVFLGGLSRACIGIGLMLILLGLTRMIKKDSLRWLRITLTILWCSIIGIVLLFTLIVSALLLSGF